MCADPRETPRRKDKKMPTGYTSYIEKGCSLREYALVCARAFGACIDFMEDSWDKEIPDEVPVSTYNKGEWERAKAELIDLQILTLEEAEEKAKAEYILQEKNYEKYLKESKETEKKYADMLLRVKAWNPPTEEHKNLKKFMVEQIHTGNSHMSEYYEKKLAELKPLSTEEWLKKEAEEILRKIQYHKTQYDKDVERMEHRNKWIKDLKTSLL
jgi:hypothetical protein